MAQEQEIEKRVFTIQYREIADDLEQNPSPGEAKAQKRTVEG